MSKNRILVFLVISFTLFSYNYGQDRIFLSPGLKLGYAFGDNGGFVYGFEISIINYSDDHIYGGVISYEIFQHQERLHVGAETHLTGLGKNLGWIGIELGPTFVINKGENNIGFSITPYSGFILLPYYRMNIIPDEDIQHEIGSFIKLPFMIIGKPIRL